MLSRFATARAQPFLRDPAVHRPDLLGFDLVDDDDPLRRLAHGAFDEVDLDPALVQLLDQDVLVDVIAREAIGAVHEHPIDEPVGRGVAQGIQPRTIEARTADAIIEIASLRGYRHAYRAAGPFEGFDLRGHGLVPLLPGGRDARVEGCAQRHVLISSCSWFRSASPSGPRAGDAGLLGSGSKRTAAWSITSFTIWPSRSIPSDWPCDRNSTCQQRFRIGAVPHVANTPISIVDLGQVLGFLHGPLLCCPPSPTGRNLENSAVQDEAQRICRVVSITRRCPCSVAGARPNPVGASAPAADRRAAGASAAP